MTQTMRERLIETVTSHPAVSSDWAGESVLFDGSCILSADDVRALVDAILAELREPDRSMIDAIREP